MMNQNVWFHKSVPVSEMRVVLPGDHGKQQFDNPNKFGREWKEIVKNHPDPNPKKIQKVPGNFSSRGPLLNFEGIGNVNGDLTADPNGDVGPNNYIQTINSSFAVWDKSGNLLYGPVDYKTIWASFPGPWSTYYWGDPIVKYDQMADRWVMISLAIDYYGTGFYTMIAVSETSDPLGSYYCYSYSFDEQPDYPKISVWPDAYYITLNVIDFNTSDYYHTLYAAVDRDAMLEGETLANMIGFEVVDPGEIYLFPLPADCRGNFVPVNEPCPIVKLGRHIQTNPWLLSLDVYEFSVNWDVPGNSTFYQVFQHDIGQFETLSGGFGPGAPQLGSDTNVMTIPLYMMYPLTFRKFSNQNTLVCCFTVWEEDQHYITWYELRNETGDWYVYQTGNYAPGDEHYFFPSITVNGNGDMALAYSVSGEEMYPSIRFTGRRSEDSLGVMTFEELEIYKGSNYANTYQAGFGQNRWGDYTSMMVDPLDDSTFWYTNMYTTSSNDLGNWATRVFTFDLSNDSVGPYAFAGNDTLVPDIIFFETQGVAQNNSSLVWTTSGDGQFITNNSERVTYLRGPGDLDNGQVTLTMHITGYYPGTETADSMIMYLSPVSIAEVPTIGVDLNIYPNPTIDIMTVEAALSSEEPITIKILTLEGKELFTGKYTPVNKHFKQQFDLFHLPDGIYLVRVQAGVEAVTGKIVKIAE